MYLEYDGQVFLVRRGGRWFLPSHDEIPFSYETVHDCQIPGIEVVFGIPKIADFPSEWMSKDEAAWRDDVDALVRRAVNGSLTREVVGVVLRRPSNAGEILMVRAARGFTKGTWNMPGGFVQYGEEPAEALQRELREEVAVGCDGPALVGVYTRRFASPYFLRAFVYDGVATSESVRVEPTEIEGSAWMAPEEAFSRTRNPFLQESLLTLGLVRARP